MARSPAHSLVYFEIPCRSKMGAVYMFLSTLLEELRAFLSGKFFSMCEVVRVSSISRSQLVLREIPETRTTSYMLKNLRERNALLAFCHCLLMSFSCSCSRVFDWEKVEWVGHSAFAFLPKLERL